MPTHEINGIRLYYEQYGNRVSFPVVFVNGLLADTTGWRFQVPAFAPHFRVLLYDARGQGQSDKPAGPYLPDQHARDLVGLLDALHIQQAHLVGVSNGGAIAMLVAAEYPSRVGCLVLADTYAHTDALMRARLESWLLALESGGLALRFDVATPWVWGNPFLAQNQHLLEPLRQKALQASADAVRGLISGVQDYDIREKIGAIHSPTLVMVGEEDVLTPPWHAREIARAIPNAHLVIVPGAGHALPIERPMVFNALVRAFLQDEE
jgi:3-oxoadipate enol-lactonase